MQRVDEVRAQFEAWCAERNIPTEQHAEDFGPFKAGDYVHIAARTHWFAWQAASAMHGAEVERLREALQEIAEMTEHVQYGPESSINSVATCALSPASEGTKP